MNLYNHLLSLTIWLPIFGGLLLLLIGSDQRKVNLNRKLALFIAIATFAVSVLLYINFDLTTANFQFQERYNWLPGFNVYYDLAIDGIALPLILLTTFFTPIVVISGWRATNEKLNQYLAAFLMMAGLMCGVFAARDTILFYFFWEAMLIPMFLIIGIWGGANRINASIKFFLYTFLGSILMLVALLYLGNQAGSFNLADLSADKLSLGLTAQKYLFLAFFIAFAVKVPMWPVHTWLPHAHVEAPTGGSVILAAIMLKMGGYGFIRFCLPIAPLGSLYFAHAVIILSLIAIVYIGIVAVMQKDMKRLIAYSSIAHMGFVTLGVFAMFLLAQNSDSQLTAVMGMQGAMIQMISHGFISGALFLCVGVLYDRVHSRDISSYGGVVNTMPVFASFMMLFAMANAGLPGTSGFVGELLVILTSFQLGFWIALGAATTLILAAVFTLWMYKRVIFGDVANPKVAKLHDLNTRETIVLSVLAVSVLFFGIYPKPMTDVMAPAVTQLVDNTYRQIEKTKVALTDQAPVDLGFEYE